MAGFKSTTFLMSICLPAVAASASADGTGGVWRNPEDSVHVEVQHCGTGMCGTVIWANEKAIADAKRGGTDNLIGLQLFRDFTRDRKGIWHGRVFVPDINKTFSGTIEILDENTRRGSGCLLGRFACKSQTWVRVK
ncbi:MULTISPECIES: DUF2147 domain-containing protein [unclassified Novosphingobium]|uniref:DUF2147 domain-containing protein n=1 Tax=unclassified Novosphingobium TaxID=2644732 RepID=UPI00146E3919|nr:MULTISPECIES: DUF2147 domain-containing protein [unclassified Novosphingobium]NMN06830.1 uncharacterized protein (DUF2147 family) [Novosphingobium sp. SG919]NMN88720.1 uncharacterized protein (DUF2147 family) [Novosphingobium sp. SG916]